MNPKAWEEERHAARTAEWTGMPEAARADIPEHLREGLDRYILHRIRPGGFLCAVLSNDLAGAAVRADPSEATMVALPGLVRAIYTYAPAPCHGSPEAVEAWLSAR